MDEKEWLKAIKCSKEELIEWLNEMYEDEKINRRIILDYEENYNVGKEKVQEAFYNPITRKQELRYYTKIKAKNFEYSRNWGD